MVRTRRALLTKTNREFLPNQGSYYQGEYAKQNRNDAYNGMRERLEHSIKDFTILFDHWPDSERQKLFGDERGVIEDDELRKGARDCLAFILRETGVINNILRGGQDETAANEILIEGLQRVADEHSATFVVTDLEFKPITEHVNFDGAKEKARNGEDLSMAEHRALIDSGIARLELTE